jgi:predicted MFS family arabinose efflux permease
MLLLAIGPMGAFYLLTLYMQHIVSYSPIATGLAWLPFGAGIVLGAGVSSKLVLRLAPRGVAAPGMLLGSLALLWLSRIGAEPNYFGLIMPAIFGLAFGFAMSVVSLTLTAVKGVQAQDTGIASALLNASQQIGVALGLAILSTISVTTTSRRMPDALAVLHGARASGNSSTIPAASQALIQGYRVALLAGAAAIALAALVTAVLVNARKGELSPPEAGASH